MIRNKKSNKIIIRNFTANPKRHIRRNAILKAMDIDPKAKKVGSDNLAELWVFNYVPHKNKLMKSIFD